MNDRIHHAEGVEVVGVYRFESESRPGTFYENVTANYCPCPARSLCKHKRRARIRDAKRRGGTLRAAAERVAHENLSVEERLEAMHELRAMRGGAA